MARRARYDEKRQSIVQAALRVLVDVGFEDTTVDRVISAAGVSKGTFYHYFGSKKALVEASTVDVTEAVTDDVDAAVQRAMPTGGPIPALEVVLALVRPEVDNRGLAGVLLRTPALEGLRTRVFTMLNRDLTPIVRKVLDEGTRAGLFRVDDPEVTAEMLVALTLSTRARVLAQVETTPSAATRRVEAFLTIVERALGLPPSTFGR